VSDAHKPEDFFFLIVPTTSGKADINTLWRLCLLPAMLQKAFFPLTVAGKGVTIARTTAFSELQAQLDRLGVQHGGKVRAMLWDDDLIINPAYDLRKLAASMMEADKHGWNLIGNYKVRQTHELHAANVLMHHSGRGMVEAYTNEELAELKNLQELPDTVSGLGFYYGWIDLDYKFHYDEIPEDVNFFIDQKLLVRYVDVPLLHEKRVLI
jgi:hypothetical protein